MSNYVYIATSLDGYIATEDGGIEWLSDIPNPNNSDYGFNAFIQKIDAIVMGRNTFEKVLSFGQWPYEKKVFVFSNKLKKVPGNLTEKVKIITGDVKTVVADINKMGFVNLYIDGGKTIQSFLKEGLIDEMIITRIPILLGAGIPLFGKLEKPIRFDKVETEILDDLLVKSHYKITSKI
ncbi:dihydrofolate reductase family protein [uncultured Ilyobacter sp.]|uniref:dihydrofolate reductase family protein n=1 Tax=uncultured Ilyobacter sp. TaxID=544433 RepID=UPI0029C6E930|nr:dihydrofolate reductase family protein [uncultured Ilyobacter sp.]